MFDRAEIFRPGFEHPGENGGRPQGSPLQGTAGRREERDVEDAVPYIQDGR